MFGIFGALVKFFAWTVGLGAAVLSRFGSATGWGGAGSAAYAPTAPTPQAPPGLQESSSVDEPSVLQDSGFADQELPSAQFEPEEEGEKPPPTGSEP